MATRGKRTRNLSTRKKSIVEKEPVSMEMDLPQKTAEGDMAYILNDIVQFNTVDGIQSELSPVKIFVNPDPESRRKMTEPDELGYSNYTCCPLKDLPYKFCTRCGSVFDLRNYHEDVQCSIVNVLSESFLQPCCPEMQLRVSEPTPEEVNTVLYHGNCADGTGSLWAVHRKMCKTKGHQTALSEVNSFGDDHKKGDNRFRITDILSICKDNNILIADFSYPVELITKIKIVCNKLILLDHHDTGAKMLGSEPNCYFDMNHSAAYMVWYFMETGEPLQRTPCNKQPPAVIRYIQDRDLWKWKEPHSREINCGLYRKSKDGKLDYYDFFHDHEEETLQELKHYGEQYLAFQADTIENAIGIAYKRKFFGYDAIVANIAIAPSETCEKLLEKHKDCRIAIVYYDDNENKIHKFSARRRENDVDIVLSNILQRAFAHVGVGWGGGGHPAAAGFTIPIHLSVEFFFQVYGNPRMLQ